MKRAVFLLAILFVLTGCNGKNAAIDQGMALRERILAADGCSFEMEVTADFGDATYSFGLQCDADKQGNVRFSVLAPETIAGITGIIENAGGKLTFDDKALAFSLLADGEISPVSAPWLVLKTLRSGYLSAASAEGEYTHIIANDSYEADALQVDIWLDQQGMPIQAETIWQGRRVLSMQIHNFTIV